MVAGNLSTVCDYKTDMRTAQHTAMHYYIYRMVNNFNGKNYYQIELLQKEIKVDGLIITCNHQSALLYSS